MKWYHSIRFRLMMIISSLVVGSLIVVSGTSYYFANRYLSESIAATEASVASDIGFRVKTDMDLLIVQLEDLASIARLQSGDKAQILPAIQEAHKRIGKFENILFASPDGNSINEAATVLNVGDREYFKKVMSTNKPYVSEVFISRYTKKPSVALVVPVTSLVHIIV